MAASPLANASAACCGKTRKGGKSESCLNRIYQVRLPPLDCGILAFPLIARVHCKCFRDLAARLLSRNRYQQTPWRQRRRSLITCHCITEKCRRMTFEPKKRQYLTGNCLDFGIPHPISISASIAFTRSDAIIRGHFIHTELCPKH